MTGIESSIWPQKQWCDVINSGGREGSENELIACRKQTKSKWLVQIKRDDGDENGVI